MVSTIFRHYKLNEASGNAIDSSANLVDATETGTVPAQAGGKISGARGVYSTLNYFTALQNNTFSSSQDMSICCWVKYIGPHNEHEFFVTNDAATNCFNLYFCRLDTTDWVFGWWKAGQSGIFARKTQNLTEGTWYWMCGTYNASTGAEELYIDNVNVSSKTYNQGNAAADGNFTIGAFYDYPAAHFYIDDLRIYTNVFCLLTKWHLFIIQEVEQKTNYQYQRK